MTFKPFSFRTRTPESKDRSTYMMGVARSLMANLSKEYDPNDAASMAWCLVKAARIGSKNHQDSLAALSSLDRSQLGDLRAAIRGTIASEKTTESPMRLELAKDILTMLNGFVSRLGSKAQASREPAPLAHSQPLLAPQGGAPAAAAAAKPVSRILNRETGKVFETVACGAGFDAFFEIKLENGEPMYELVTSIGDVNET
jgi:hypothetical protein